MAKKEEKKSRLLILYRFGKDLASCGYNDELVVGLPHKEFQALLMEDIALLNRFPPKSEEEYLSATEWKFDTEFGKLYIYDKDAQK